MKQVLTQILKVKKTSGSNCLLFVFISISLLTLILSIKNEHSGHAEIKLLKIKKQSGNLKDHQVTTAKNLLEEKGCLGVI